jgi:cytochrome c oxidase subunit IV
VNLLGDAAAGFVTSAMDKIAKAMWSAALWVLRGAFELMDSLLGFGDGSGLVDADGRLAADTPLAGIWPTMLWISAAVAFGLFLWQLTTTVARGGAGFWRAVSGPVAYGIAIAMTAGIIAALLGGAEGLTSMLLQQGLDSDNFQTMFTTGKMAEVFTDNPDLGAAAANTDETVRSLVLFIVALFGVIPAGLGFALQMIFRQGVIWILLATIPITAAGLMTQTTSAMFWRNVRWALAAIIMKPALALVLVVGVNLMSAPTGVGGLLVGTGVLLIAVFCPMTVYRLLSFVEPGTQAGMALRSLSSQGSSSGPGGGAGGGGSAVQANTARFDAASGGAGGGAGSGAAGGAALGAAGAVAAVGAAVSGAAHGASNVTNSQMDATGIGAGVGGLRRVGPADGGSPSGGSSQPGSGSAAGDDPGGTGGSGSSGATAPTDQPAYQHEAGSGPGGDVHFPETSPPEQPMRNDSAASGPEAAGGAGEAVIP